MTWPAPDQQQAKPTDPYATVKGLLVIVVIAAIVLVWVDRGARAALVTFIGLMAFTAAVTALVTFLTRRRTR